MLAPVNQDYDDRTLILDADVLLGEHPWQAGDWIVVGTTSFSPFESEFVQIAPNGLSLVTVTGKLTSVTRITLAQPLRHYHFGSLDPGIPTSKNLKQDILHNYGVDERAEVGLISRNIKLTSTTPSITTGVNGNKGTPAVHWGGEIKICKGFSEAKIEGVEIEKFGKEKLSSYPIHFHMDDDVANQKPLVKANSIHHSYNKCITVHSTQNVTVEDNICARIVGHLFYQEYGNEYNTTFLNNLGLGAMSHHFGIDDKSVPMADPKLSDWNGQDWPQNWWEGDYLARIIDFDGYNVQNTDNKFNPTHGSCFGLDPNKPGALLGSPKEFDDKGQCPSTSPYYAEPASGFWMTNPTTKLSGNSIGGCQGVGVGYWYVPPGGGTNLETLEVGTFLNNRVHGCYQGLYGEGFLGIMSQQLVPRKGVKTATDITKSPLLKPNVITKLQGLTATRIRNRGVWVRPVWTVVKDSRFATNRDSVSLVSSGGNDGNAPGVWELLKDSVLVGISANNVDRWGPCPDHSVKVFGGQDGTGCVDYNPQANELWELGYQFPRWNSAGYFIYDGPVRIIGDHFVNYLKDIEPLLTSTDKAFLAGYNQFSNSPPITDDKAKKYEGDAALGWFQANQSAYPTATVSRALSFENVDLRHQIFTDKVNFDTFKDGDKNTALLDLDGTLTSYMVVGPQVENNNQPPTKVEGEFPISLNNLPINHSSNAADECLASGQQNDKLEQRPTSLISPGNMATLEFEALYPEWVNPKDVKVKEYWQDIFLTKDSLDNGQHQSMALNGRDGRGVWEPKVTSGFGYTIIPAKSTANVDSDKKMAPGMPKTVRVGFTDAVKSKISKDNPFYIRVGICYNGEKGPPQDPTKFNIQRGYKSWGGNGVNQNSQELNRYWIKLGIPYTYKNQNCHNLDSQIPENNGPTGCPADGLTVVDKDLGLTCPTGNPTTTMFIGWQGENDQHQPININANLCVHPKTSLVKAEKLEELTDLDSGKPTADGFTKYFYDVNTGMLFFYVVQDSANAIGPSPIGSCNNTDDPDCPQQNELETYYSCPPEGCVNYSVVLNDEDYTPSPPIKCDVSTLYTNNEKYKLPVPGGQNRLAFKTTTDVVKDVAVVEKVNSQSFLHWYPGQKGTDWGCNN